MHANYFVNLGGGRAGEVRELMARVVAGVEARFGVVLEPEVKVIGVLGEIATW
jgi:UDP-N-acetylmuramate dehydrogenase